MTDPKLYAKTYWSNNGRHERLAQEVQKLVPAHGELPDGNPGLEIFRQAANCYYDLYNNGLCNRADEFRVVFGFDGPHEDEELTKATVNRIERRMDRFILAAAKEQGIKLEESND